MQWQKAGTCQLQGAGDLKSWMDLKMTVFLHMQWFMREAEQRQLAARGCGFMIIYEAGVLKALRELSPEILKSASKIYGVSSGSFIAALAVCECDIDEMLPSFFSTVNDTNVLYYSSRKNALHGLRTTLNKVLPTNAHQLASGRLHIVLTQVPDWKNVVISEFASKEDIVQAVICSCFIPVYFGFIPPLYHGVRYIDGEFALGQASFVTKATITVCAFMGEYDICPRENPTAFLVVQPTSFLLQISTANMYRIWCVFVPPTQQILDGFYWCGYMDTDSFLQRLSEFGISYFAKDYMFLLENGEKGKEKPATRGLHSRATGPKDMEKENAVVWAANGMKEEAQQLLLHAHKAPAPPEKQDMPGELSKSTKSVLKSIGYFGFLIRKSFTVFARNLLILAKRVF